MLEDPYALKLYIDGNAYNNPGGSGGFACFVDYPEAWGKLSVELFSEGFHETTNNRMELLACIRALEYVRDKAASIGVERVQVFTDSKYVSDNQNMPAIWRRLGWKTRFGKPVENSDLWRRFLTVRLQGKVRVDIGWCKGKKSPILKSVDKSAKAVGKLPSKPDRGFRSGKVGKSQKPGMASSPFPAKGQAQVIRIYKSSLIGKSGHKIYFDVFDEQSGEYHEKCTCYVPDSFINELHRGHVYRVKFNADDKCPMVLAIVEELIVDSKNS
jgi:ribonuclease HI